LNPDKDKASNAQIMFLCLHASGLTLIPVSIIAIRSSMGSETPTDIFLPCMIATFCATMAAMIIVSIRQKINLFQPIVLAYVGGISAIIALLVIYLVQLNKEELDSFSKVMSNGIILLIFFAIVLGAVYKKINIFDAFIDGAKEGFTVCVKIIPYLVGMLIAISLLRTVVFLM
jgi:spore maturation protein SpmA